MRNLMSAAFGAALASSAGSPAFADDLRGSQRTFLVFAAADDPELAKQSALLAGVSAKDFDERDLLVLQVPPTGETRTLFGQGGEPRSAAVLRESRGVEPGAGFTVLLVGKDGGTKWREERPARPEELFGLIDAMPMRVQEMRRNRPGG